MGKHNIVYLCRLNKHIQYNIQKYNILMSESYTKLCWTISTPHSLWMSYVWRQLESKTGVSPNPAMYVKYIQFIHVLYVCSTISYFYCAFINYLIAFVFMLHILGQSIFTHPGFFFQIFFLHYALTIVSFTLFNGLGNIKYCVHIISWFLLIQVKPVQGLSLLHSPTPKVP